MDTTLLSEATVEDLARGFRHDQSGQLACLFCTATFPHGEVFRDGDRLLMPEAAAALHVQTAHGGAFAALCGLGPAASGVPEVQFQVLRMLGEGKDDAQIAAELGGKAASTVRNHRFLLRKREAEARIFLALMQLLDLADRGAGRFLAYPPGMPASDERAAVTGEEASVIEARYLKPRVSYTEAGLAAASGSGGWQTGASDPGALYGMAAEQAPGFASSAAGAASGGTAAAGGRALPAFYMAAWPKRQKEKLVLLRRIALLFQDGRRYSEREVNGILAPVWSDYVTIRRYLIEYGFLRRKPDGSEYWRS